METNSAVLQLNAGFTIPPGLEGGGFVLLARRGDAVMGK